MKDGKTVASTPETIWSCPVCGLPAEELWGSVRCSSGHNFDHSRYGYINFLTGGRPKPEIGDSEEMLQARRRFLVRGLYDPLIDALDAVLADVVLSQRIQPTQTFRLLEAGSGEGYYLGSLAKRRPELVALGFDVAKAGAKMAAQSYSNVHWAVADTNGTLPVASQSISVLLDIFAPRNAREFTRVVAPGGSLIVVIPAPDHLEALRPWTKLLQIQTDKLQTIQLQFSDFKLASSRDLALSFPGTPVVVSDLVGMSPSARHMDDNTWTDQLPKEFIVTAHFQILHFINQ